ncbi:uncharacterized protein ARMOST_11871 [Armillaria ostoyae]|uniref:Tc1-like transposase DDE domain-containing protein n=1 Tax=Armillaria ostoyae TaxID=47428 RepID=A0A284RIG3_ARMOS|nr:uncharacterized protein ARMOST_11871 [Armillaria ostoyae]
MSMVLRARLDLMLSFLRLYRSQDFQDWTGTSNLVAQAAGRGPWMARKLREWSTSFCNDEKKLPTAEYGKFNSSVLEDEDIAQDIHVHLQSLGKWISAMDIVRYVATPEFQARLRVKKGITERTAQRWMKRMGYRWKAEPKGIYSDGHERADVVNYRQNVFLPLWVELERATRWWKADATEDELNGQTASERAFIARPDGKIIVIWRHDESTFYANDRRKIRWVHASETAKPYAKGEGASLMVGDFVSPDYGWLKSLDGKEDARVLLRPGKTHDGYQTTEDILKQATRAMDILDHDYPDETHVFAYDNATIHTARQPDALSALNMTLKPSSKFHCKSKSNSDDKIPMMPGRFMDGSPQYLYFPAGHELAGQFKGMRVLIQERIAKGHKLQDPMKLKAECKNFKCEKGRTDCCCRRILFSEPDFVNQKSMLEEHCLARGYLVIFFPKYHPELNFIEQCWGFAKRVYRMFPTSSSESDLKDNLLAALDAVPLASMRWYMSSSCFFSISNIPNPRFATRSSRFADGYHLGLDGADAAWVTKRFRGHRTVPPSYRAELEKERKRNPIRQ